MALGEYNLTETVRIPLQLDADGIAINTLSPQIEKIVGPDNKEISGFPKAMTELDGESGAYYYDFKPSSLGSYFVIISVVSSGDKLVTMETFFVRAAELVSLKIPRAEAR